MKMVYGISAIALIIAFILIKKTEKKLNIISFTSLSIVLMLCYNTFVCYVLTFFKIPNTLTILSTINYIITVIILSFIIQKKKIQKYQFDLGRTNLYRNNFNFSTYTWILRIWIPI